MLYYMDILINSTQTRKIIVESKIKSVGSIIESGYNLTKDILEKGGKQIGENLTFLFTWGASIAGIIGPLNDFISGKFPELNDIQISLILTGIITNYYFDNKKLINKIFKKIKEENLTSYFSEVLFKAEELKRIFIEFIRSLNLTVHKMSNIMSYAFIIPIIPMIYESISQGMLTSENAFELGTRIAAFGLITLSGLAIKQLINKIISRFES